MSNPEWVNPCQGCNTRDARIEALEAQLAAAREALDNSQSLLVMMYHLGTAGGAIGITAKTWIDEQLTTQMANQITENRTALGKDTHQ